MTISAATDLLRRSDLPGGMPDFAGVTPSLCLEALREGMRLEAERWDAIASCVEAPTIANTLEALESASDAYDRAEAVFYTLVSCVGGPQWDAAEAEIIPDFVRHHHTFVTHRGLYERLRALRETVDPAQSPQTAYVLDDYLRDFRREGIDLSPADQQRLADLDLAIGQAEQAFTQACVKARDAAAYTIGEAGALAETLADAGVRTVGDTMTIPLTNYSAHPLLVRLTDPTHRAGLMQASLNRANGTGALDTRDLVATLARLRSERARLLGFATFADYAMDEAVAPSAQAVVDLLSGLADPAQQAVSADAAALTELARAEHGPDYALAPGDWGYYEEKLRASRFTFAEADLRPYLDLERVITDGVFYAATCLYGITFTPRPDIPAWGEDVRVWEVRDESGLTLGLFAGDYFTSPHKGGGTWMHELVAANGLTGELPVIANTCNFTKPAPGEPALLTWDEVITCFHEFGHALHGLFAATRYPSHAGTSVPRDFVEFPSQLNEMWAYHPQVLSRFVRHHATGLPAPEAVIAEIAASATFGQAYQTLEYLQAALIDLEWHRTPAADLPDAAGVDAFEADAVARHNVAHPLVPPRYRSTYFDHTFGGNYGSAYCSYMWAELMVADMEEWIRTGPLAGDNAGLNRQVGQVLRDEVLSRGDSRDPLASYRAVTGGDPDPAALLRRRGLK